MRRILALLLVALCLPSAATAAPGDTTWVSTYQQEFINWATPHYATYNLPADPPQWSKIVMRLTIECPGAPNDCDPWDRLGHLRIVTPDQGDIEIARFITPYDITGAGFPGVCSWTHNVTPWKSLLHGDVELRLYVESWIGGNNGWLITTDFAFIEGELAEEPYRVVKLWGDDHLEYGNPSNPIATQIPAMDLDVPADVTKAEIRVFTTGHGQGNTLNCAEFCQREHRVLANGTQFDHLLWRSNCSTNACSPQGGNWSFGRAGWCPGAGAPPWKVDITSVAPVGGGTIPVQYDVEAYENLCRPDNPDCVSGQTCTDCNFNTTGHTNPHYTMQASAIFYRDRADVVSVNLSELRESDRVQLGAAAPNPFTPATEFTYAVPRAGTVELLIYDAAGRIVMREERVHSTPGTHRFRWDGRDRAGRTAAAGAYFYSVRMDGKSESRKMIRVR